MKPTFCSRTSTRGLLKLNMNWEGSGLFAHGMFRFTGVPPGQESGDEERAGNDMSTGVTVTSR